MPVFDTIRERFGVDVRDIAGAHLSGEIPLSTDFVNRQIAERLGNHRRITAVRVQPLEGDTLAIQLVPRARLIPPLNLTARVERQPEFPQNPTLLLRWSMPAAGPLALFAAPVLSYFKAMPPGIRMDSDRIIVDLREMLRARGLEEIAGLLRKLAIHTRRDGFLVQFDISVNP